MLIGNVEAKEMDVSSKTPGRIMKLYVDEGEEVEKRDLLFEIDPKDLQVKKMQAEAAVRAAEAQLNKALSGARQQEINSAKVLLEKPKKSLIYWKRNMKDTCLSMKPGPYPRTNWMTWKQS